MKRTIIAAIALALVILACNGGATPTVPPTPQESVFDTTETAYGFFPTPPEASLESVFQLYKDLGAHADFVLLQEGIPWEEFLQGADVESQHITDISNQYIIASQNNIYIIYVV